MTAIVPDPFQSPSEVCRPPGPPFQPGGRSARSLWPEGLSRKECSARPIAGPPGEQAMGAGNNQQRLVRRENIGGGAARAGGGDGVHRHGRQLDGRA
eukprot:4990914-Pyramimonas_sp.AAC.1